MPRKIIDEFTNLPVSRQRKAQLRAVKRGLCGQCFKRPVVACERCDRCLEKWQPVQRAYARQYYRKRKARGA